MSCYRCRKSIAEGPADLCVDCEKDYQAELMADFPYDNEDCPYCGGEGFIEDECECESIVDQCSCLHPTPRRCRHC